MDYRILTEMVEVEAVVSEWDQLLERSPCNRAFSSAAWYLTACRADPPRRMYVVTARRNGRLTGLLPLVLREHGAAFAGGLADYQDLIGEAGDEESLAGLLNHALLSGPRLTLGHCRQDGNLVRALAVLEPAFDFNRFSQRQDCCHIRLSGNFEDFLASRSYMFRKQLRRALRKADRDGVTAREVTAEELAPDRLPKVFLDLHLRRFAERSCFNRPAYHAFVRLALPILFRQKRLRVFCLFHGGRRVGIDLYMVGRSSIGTWNAGYLEELAPWSPGKLMLTSAVKTALADGLDEVDLLRGTQPWKLSWATGQHSFGEIVLPAKRHATDP